MLVSFLADLRRVALASSITSFAAALVLFAGYHERTLHGIFVALFAVSALLASVLVRSWLKRRVR